MIMIFIKKKIFGHGTAKSEVSEDAKWYLVQVITTAKLPQGQAATVPLTDKGRKQTKTKTKELKSLSSGQNKIAFI